MSIDSEKPAKTPTRNASGHFEPGTARPPAAGRGRKIASRDKLSQHFIECMQKDFERNGMGTIVTVRQEKPVEYLKLVAQLIPKEHKVEINHEIKQLTDEQVLARVNELERAIVEGTGKSLQDMLPDIIDGEYETID